MGNRVATFFWERVVNSACHLFFLSLINCICLSYLWCWELDVDLIISVPEFIYFTRKQAPSLGLRMQRNFFSRFWYFFFQFSKKIGFDIICKLSSKETICMKHQGLFPGKIKKNIMKLSSAEIAQKMVKFQVTVSKKRQWSYNSLLHKDV